jgi:SsrA-binding protein
MPTLAENKKARFDYEILDTFEAGLVLTGPEVKSVRGGSMGMRGSYVTIANGGVWLIAAHIPRYPQAGAQPDYDPDRSRRLLLHTREIAKLAGKLEQKGFTLVPLEVYTKGNRIKLKFGLGRGKKEYQKKETIKKRESDREVRRALKG